MQRFIHQPYSNYELKHFILDVEAFKGIQRLFLILWSIVESPEERHNKVQRMHKTVGQCAFRIYMKFM